MNRKTQALLISSSIFLLGCGGSSSSSSKNNTITHKGYTYETITSPITGKQWLDRNLGAYKVCTKSRDEKKADKSDYFANDAAYVLDQKDCFGDYYQWGRNADKHQEAIDDTISTPNKTKSNTTVSFANEITNMNNNDFIISNSSNNYDWTLKSVDNSGVKRIANWNKSDGSGICPNGFRVPTIDELKAETIDNSIQDTDVNNNGNIKVINRDTAFKSFLKLPISGYRGGSPTSVLSQGFLGGIWSNSANNSDSINLQFSNNSANTLNDSRADAYTIRCIKN